MPLSTPAGRALLAVLVATALLACPRLVAGQSFNVTSGGLDYGEQRPRREIPAASGATWPEVHPLRCPPTELWVAPHHTSEVYTVVANATELVSNASATFWCCTAVAARVSARVKAAHLLTHCADRRNRGGTSRVQAVARNHDLQLPRCLLTRGSHAAAVVVDMKNETHRWYHHRTPACW